MSTTKKGYELAAKLLPLIGQTPAIVETCSLICRHAVTLHHLNEDDCNGHPANANPNVPADSLAKLQERWEARVEAGQERTLRRLCQLVELLPEPEIDGERGSWRFEPESDPRGCSVILVIGLDWASGDSWGDRNGICIPR